MNNVKFRVYSRDIPGDGLADVVSMNWGGDGEPSVVTVYKNGATTVHYVSEVTLIQSTGVHLDGVPLYEGDRLEVIDADEDSEIFTIKRVGASFCVDWPTDDNAPVDWAIRIWEEEGCTVKLLPFSPEALEAKQQEQKEITK